MLHVELSFSISKIISHLMTNSKVLITLAILLALSQSILLMIRPKVPRCMVEYITHDNFQSAVKIMIDFKGFSQPVTGQHFFVYIRNTENNWNTTATVKPGGKYYEEIKFEKNVIYEVCVNFKTDRKEDALIEYDAQTMFNDAETSPVIPEHLLKKSDFKDTYVAAARLVETISDYTLEHNARNKQDNIDFTNTNELNRKVTIISVIELVVLVAAGAYQFFTLKNYLVGKQYI